MRTAFVDSLLSIMEKDKSVVLLTADMGFSVFEELKARFPNRFFNTGASEQSTIGLAAGMSLSGLKVFVYAQASFITMRCFEQVRLDLAYNKLNVTLVGVAAGYTLNQLGVSHFAIEDISLMRSLPEMTVFAPGDPDEARLATKKAYSLSGPSYLRLSNAGSPSVHVQTVKNIDTPIQLDSGKKGALIVSGSLLPMAVVIIQKLKKKNVNISLFSMPIIKPLNIKFLENLKTSYKYIFTLEDHNIIGGLGSAISEFIAENGPAVKVVRFGIPDEYLSITGSRDYLLKKSGISADIISKKIISLIS